MDVDSVLAANNPMSGLLGGALGDPAPKARVEEAKKNAKDLTGLVRKKAKDESKVEGEAATTTAAAAETTTPTTANGTKRKAEDPADGEEDESKKPKVQEPAAEVAATAES